MIWKYSANRCKYHNKIENAILFSMKTIFKKKNRSGGSDITFQFFGAKNDGQKVREAVNRMVERGRLGNFSLVPTYLSFRQEPGLLLQVIYITEKPHVLDIQKKKENMKEENMKNRQDKWVFHKEIFFYFSVIISYRIIILISMELWGSVIKVLFIIFLFFHTILIESICFYEKNMFYSSLLEGLLYPKHINNK